ncbi:hypothetical protein GIB67_025855 [Kingdonia uniflora]|uniref:Uncharacterized protein n=1 Tax=Kingdonia uniflora TaxID=39325 RepID=A0A7J7MD99_9MAGN|nr:hypothetical protein GIB67_025855 [Kingdonia uniflora]
MISQFFVMSQRGDNIVFRDYRGDVPKGSAEIFFRKVKFWKEDEEEDAPPVFVGRIGYCLIEQFNTYLSNASRLIGLPFESPSQQIFIYSEAGGIQKQDLTFESLFMFIEAPRMRLKLGDCDDWQHLIIDDYDKDVWLIHNSIEKL